MRSEPEEWRFSEEAEFVERDCLLFEAGEYPDRGITITPDDLRQIARNSPGEIPVTIEHLLETPFDRALGVITRIRATGAQLWGTLRQPVEAWRFVQRAGARALSVALDLAAKRVVETSFVCRPRVAGAQVFEGSTARFRSSPLFDVGKKEEDRMISVRQFAEGLIQYLRGVVVRDETGTEAAQFAAERTALEAERQELRRQSADQQVLELKRRGLVRAGGEAERLACAILLFGEARAVSFGAEELPLSTLFKRFLEQNGGVVPMGELSQSDAIAASGASDRLIAMARETAKRDNLPYPAAFSRVGAAHPELARAAREEGF